MGFSWTGRGDASSCLASDWEEEEEDDEEEEESSDMTTSLDLVSCLAAAS